MATPPRVFISYSHDSEPHKTWVLTLATRLMSNGVDVILDQWDLNLGSDLPHFIESGLSEADRVLAICSDNYVAKANNRQGGVGYENTILTAQVMENVRQERIIPIVFANEGSMLVPVFLSSRVYIDFRRSEAYENKYAELIREIHGERIRPRPPLGHNPFAESWQPSVPPLSFRSERYHSPAIEGVVRFDYSNNNGRYTVGAGEMAFETAWSSGGSTAIHAYTDPPSIRTVALALGFTSIKAIDNAAIFDTSSRVRTPSLGEIVIWQNTAGYYLATKIEQLAARHAGSWADEIVFSYTIQANRSSSFILPVAPLAQP